MRLELVEIAAVNARINMLTFRGAEGGALPSYSAGAHVDFDLPEVGIRSYSLIDFTAPGDAPTAYRIAVQREGEGEGGSQAMHRLNRGDVIEATEPKNDFHLHENDAPALLLAGGIGVTPIISFATELSRRAVAFAFHYASRSADQCAFRQKLENRFPDAINFCLDDTNPIDLKGLLENISPDTQVYCCGPKGMIEAVRDLAEAQAIPKAQVHFELFASPSSHEGDQPFEVQINDGRVFAIPADKTIVDVLEDADVDVMFDCQRGDCGICQTDVIEGEPDHRDVVLSDAERSEGKVMQICVSRAKSARLVLDI